MDFITKDREAEIKTGWHVRWMIRRDYPEVLDIEFLGGALGWSEQDFLAAGRERLTIAMVSETIATPHPVGGFMVYEIGKKSLLIKNMAVHPDMKRRGCGTAMMNKMKSKLSSHRRTALICWVPDSALSMHLFLKAHGFIADKIDRGTPYGDQYRFVYRL